MHLRQRKVENYQQLLEDENTVKTLKDERIEIKRMRGVSQLEEELVD